MSFTSTHMKSFSLIALAVASLMIVSCKEKNAPEPDVEEEVITTVFVTLSSGVIAESYEWEDIDGVGGNPPNRIDTIRVRTGATYEGRILVINRSVSPEVGITPEIRELADNHQFFFTVTNGVATVAATDADSRSLPLGLIFSLIPGSVGEGTLTLALSHWESATAKDGITPSDETDISVTFPMIVE